MAYNYKNTSVTYRGIGTISQMSASRHLTDKIQIYMQS